MCSLSLKTTCSGTNIKNSDFNEVMKIKTGLETCRNDIFDVLLLLIISNSRYFKERLESSCKLYLLYIDITFCTRTLNDIKANKMV